MKRAPPEEPPDDEDGFLPFDRGFDIEKARELRDEAMERTANAQPEAVERITPLIAESARRQVSLTTDDVEREMVRRGIDMPDEKRVFGSLMSNARRAGLIRPTKVWVKSERKSNHSRDIKVWDSLIYKPIEEPIQ